MDDNDSIDPWNPGTVDGNSTRLIPEKLWSNPWGSWFYGTPGTRVIEMATGSNATHWVHTYLKGGRGGPGPDPIDGHTSNPDWSINPAGPMPETDEDKAAFLAQYLIDSYQFAPDDDVFL